MSRVVLLSLLAGESTEKRRESMKSFHYFFLSTNTSITGDVQMELEVIRSLYGVLLLSIL